MTKAEQKKKWENFVKVRKNVNEQYEAAVHLADGYQVSYAACVDHCTARTAKARAKTELIDKLVRESYEMGGKIVWQGHPWPFNK